MSIDGIKKTKNSTRRVKFTVAPKPKRVFKIDDIYRPPRWLSGSVVRPNKPARPPATLKKHFSKVASLTRPVYITPFKASFKTAGQESAFGLNLKAGFKNASQTYSKFIVGQKVTLLAAVAALFLAFGGGVLTTLSAAKTAAVEQPVEPPANYQTLLPNAQISAAATNAGNDILFNTPIQYLKNYLATVAQPDIIEQRTQALTKYLQDQKSPLASAAATIAEQPHWQLILAIAFAESTLGKNCSDDNCSNIGVKPGAPSWRQYGSYQDWVVDFNRLLDKKYNDWTLKQMCGVYVQPCNPNWLLATQEVMDDLKVRDID